jgi:RNase P subunit RPR2
MEFAASGTEKSVPLVGSEIEYVRFSCSQCGQGARFERSDPDAEWQRAGL